MVFLRMGKSLVFLVAKNLQTSRKCPDSFNSAKGQKMKFLLEQSQQDSAHNKEQLTSVSCSLNFEEAQEIIR